MSAGIRLNNPAPNVAARSTGFWMNVNMPACNAAKVLIILTSAASVIDAEVGSFDVIEREKALFAILNLNFEAIEPMVTSLEHAIINPIVERDHVLR